MRGATTAISVAVMLGGCALLHEPAPPPPPPAPVVEAPAGLGCADQPHVARWERRLHRDPWFPRTIARGRRYLPRLRSILARHGLPASLALLPAVESGFDPNARGRDGERGLWQLRRQTARRFGLVVTHARDDRLQPERATEAAARYLRYLHARYGEWPLALAAYNAGEHRVDRALAREPTATFWELADHGRLPRTSRNYVPRFMAVVRMLEPAAC
jgi:soluble lytic murein transglycosylase-like protein